MASVLTHVQNVWQAQRADSPIYALFLANVTIDDASMGAIRASLQLDKNHTNSKGSLHGTMTACIIDWIAGMVIASYGLTGTGVSTDIHISYLAGAKEGEVLEISGRSMKMGGTLAFVSADITKIKDGESVVVATGLHTKYVRQKCA
jgi:acyl-coenzyme A thioesterase 13